MDPECGGAVERCGTVRYGESRCVAPD